MASHLPSELWLHTFLYLSIIDDAANSQPESWANIVTGSGIHRDDTGQTLSESNATKHALGLVSREVYALSGPLAMGLITLRTVSQARCLARTLSEKPQLTSVLSQWTKRPDICIGVKAGSENGSDPSSNVDYESCGAGSQQLLVDLELIIRLCAKLSYFNCHVHPSLSGSTIGLVDGLLDACPSLKVLRWHFTPLTMLTPSSVLPDFGELRVLDLSMATRSLDMKTDTYDLPHLHTLIGPLEVICSHFLLVQLPSFRTLICTQSIPGAGHIQSFMKFFEHHGEKIIGLDIRHAAFYCQEFLVLCPNILEVIMDGSETELFERPWPSVRSIGIIDKISDSEKATRMLLYTFGLLDSQTEKGNYPELQTVRILQERTVQRLRRLSTMGTQLYERRLRSWSIRLEDDSGALLVPQPLPGFLNQFQKGVATQVRLSGSVACYYS